MVVSPATRFMAPQSQRKSAKRKAKRAFFFLTFAGIQRGPLTCPPYKVTYKRIPEEKNAVQNQRNSSREGVFSTCLMCPVDLRRDSGSKNYYYANQHIAEIEMPMNISSEQRSEWRGWSKDECRPRSELEAALGKALDALEEMEKALEQERALREEAQLLVMKLKSDAKHPVRCDDCWIAWAAKGVRKNGEGA